MLADSTVSAFACPADNSNFTSSCFSLDRSDCCLCFAVTLHNGMPRSEVVIDCTVVDGWTSVTMAACEVMGLGEWGTSVPTLLFTEVGSTANGTGLLSLEDFPFTDPPFLTAARTGLLLPTAADLAVDSLCILETDTDATVGTGGRPPVGTGGKPSVGTGGRPPFAAPWSILIGTAPPPVPSTN